ncbi:unnamed protein product, partial [Owenia fusiformis]
MDYSNVAPPAANGGQFEQQNAFADAVARARQIAAKIAAPGAPPTNGAPAAAPTSAAPPMGGMPGMGFKRGFEGEQDAIGAQLRAIAEQQSRQSDAQNAAQAAQQAAMQINQKLGITSNPSINQQPPQMAPPSQAQGLGFVSTEEYHIPDRMVGLVIGKGGEQITRLQADSGCKVQIAPDSGGMPNRPCTLTGSAEAIDAAKRIINQIIDKGATGGIDPHNMPDGTTMVEVMIPGTKVGLVIGKGGETIKQLQETAGVKMVMIQDSNMASHVDKPLRITGEISRAQQGKQLVLDLIREKDQEMHQGYGGGGGGGGGG